jgi:hypothetical protein
MVRGVRAEEMVVLLNVVQCPIGNTWELYSRGEESKLSIRTTEKGRETNEQKHSFRFSTIIFKFYFL